MEHNRKFLLLTPPSPNGRKFIRTFDCSTESKGNYLYQPYDTLLITSFLPDNATINFIDATADNLSVDSFLNAVKETNPEIIIYAMGDSLWDSDFNCLLEIKKLKPKSKVYVFGDSFYDLETFKFITPYVSGVLKSPIEISNQTFEISLIKANDADRNSAGLKTETFFRATKKPTEFIQPIPKHKLFLNKAYRWPFSRHYSYTSVFTNWGCPYSCSYCILNSFPFFYRPSSNILEELRHIKSLGIKEVYFADRSFGVPKQNTIELMKGMLEEKMNFSWSCYFHPNQYDSDLLKLMKEAGCHTIITGIESYSDDVLKENNRKVQSNKLELLLQDAKNLGIDVCGDFILGLKEQTREEVLKTIDYSRKLNLSYASYNIATPLAGTKVRSDAVKSKQMDPLEKGFNSLGSNKIISPQNDILELRKKAVLRFYLRPWYLLKRLLRTTSFEHFVIQYQEAKSMMKK